MGNMTEIPGALRYMYSGGPPPPDQRSDVHGIEAQFLPSVLEANPRYPWVQNNKKLKIVNNTTISTTPAQGERIEKALEDQHVIKVIMPACGVLKENFHPDPDRPGIYIVNNGRNYTDKSQTVNLVFGFFKWILRKKPRVKRKAPLDPDKANPLEIRPPKI